MHSADSGKLMTSLAGLLKQDGILVFSDIIEDPNVDKKDPKMVDSKASMALRRAH